MREVEIRRLLVANLLCAVSIVLAAVVPAFFLDGFSVLGTHLTWLCVCSVSVATLNVILHLVLKPSQSPKRSSFAHKISRFLKCCIYFFMSCILFHAIIVLYGAPLIESVTETFLFAVLLSTFTTLQCLCLLGPNIQAWIRVFSKNGHMKAFLTKKDLFEDTDLEKRLFIFGVQMLNLTLYVFEGSKVPAHILLE